ncbi:MAG: inositol monophosphatase [Candidatus Zixiibacteriota bacterium]|nr:MAG: inositol monophosphatase [candidate division Zixibacteria bacterium]
MNLSNQQLRTYLAFAEKLARSSGKILARGFTEAKKVDYKGKINPVTQFDLRSEKHIIEAISRKFPDHGILAEEGGAADAGSPFRWVIDPLDGTVNYAHGFPVYCVSIALQYETSSVVGVVYDPEHKELFSAARGLGARLNGRRIRVSSRRRLERSLLATGFAYNVRTARKNNLGMFARMIKKAQAIRRLGSAALDMCWLAAGRFDGFWEYYLHPWDTAAAALIVEQAGGKVTRIDGRPFSIFDKQILASNGRIHLSMMAVLGGRPIKKAN